jgi:hypothetical protein
MACAIAAAWLVTLTILNLALGGTMRGTLFYALPVAIAAWHSLEAGFAFAGVAALSAWAGGAIAYPQAADPLWIGGMWAFLKMSAVALGARFAACLPRQDQKP